MAVTEWLSEPEVAVTVSTYGPTGGCKAVVQADCPKASARVNSISASVAPCCSHRRLNRSDSRKYAASIAPKSESNHGGNAGGCGLLRGTPGNTLPCGMVTETVDAAGLVPGVTEAGETTHVLPMSVVKQLSAIALLNDEPAGSGVSVAV